MRDRLDEFPVGTELALVVFARPELVVGYVERLALDVPVLIDANRQAYAAYGLERGSLRQVWSIGAARKYAEIFRRDGFGGLSKPTEDTRQLGGDFIVDSRGRLAWAYRGTGPEDRPTIDQLITAATAARRSPAP